MANLRQGMVSIFMAMMLADNKVHVKGSPDRYRDFVYIDDVVRAFLLCLNRPESVGRVINIAGSGKKTVGELLEVMAALHTPKHGRPDIQFSGSTPGDLMGIAADIALAEKILGYTPSVSFAEGLARMYTWADEVME